MKLESRSDRIDWDGIAGDVRTGLSYLQMVWQASERDCSPEYHRKMVEDIYFPVLRRLAEFVACIEVTEDDSGDIHAPAVKKKRTQ